MIFGSLLKWWQIVKQACAIASVFAFLRRPKIGAKRKKTLRITELMESSNESKVYCFVQALKYERLGLALLRYPMLVYQSEFLTIADWETKVHGDALSDAISRLIPPDDVEFWESMAIVEARN